jgi:hypothetical protein
MLSQHVPTALSSVSWRYFPEAAANKMYQSGRECHSLMWIKTRVHDEIRKLTLAYTNTKKIQQPVEEPLQNLKVEGVEIDQISKRLNHSGRQPYAHVFLSIEPG